MPNGYLDIGPRTKDDKLRSTKNMALQTTKKTDTLGLGLSVGHLLTAVHVEHVLLPSQVLGLALLNNGEAVAAVRLEHALGHPENNNQNTNSEV